jgi:predicted metal-dependent peptidase
MSTQEVNQKPARAIVAAVQLSSVSDVEFDASLTELRQLAKTRARGRAAPYACVSARAMMRQSSPRRETDDRRRTAG